ncbi:MAG: PAM68 family protein [Leptolyngbyaceae cyanobacterium T60_A2020_046]|nr:PAM68 family protein [Leptolyngbyaceae cyanobacterium T60_A2020_046]
MPADSDRDRLPFEPSRKRKKAEKTSSASPVVTSVEKKPKAIAQTRRADAKIPEVVSQRMFRRMLAFSGVPTGLGVVVFFASYVIIVRHIADLPNVAVLLVTLGCFGLGVVGLSYGALSASWDEKQPGGLLGFAEFKANAGRLFGAWKQAREERSGES